MHPIRHFRTITHHRHLVQKYCFRVGLYWRGLTHDLSKYFQRNSGVVRSITRAPLALRSRSAGRMAIRWHGCTTRDATATTLSTGQM